jgi:hypothetical protein
VRERDVVASGLDARPQCQQYGAIRFYPRDRAHQTCRNPPGERERERERERKRGKERGLGGHLRMAATPHEQLWSAVEFAFQNVNKSPLLLSASVHGEEDIPCFASTTNVSLPQLTPPSVDRRCTTLVSDSSPDPGAGSGGGADQSETRPPE